MTFLTVAVFKGAVPAAGKPQDDAACGTIVIGQVVAEDTACRVSSGPDLDCGQFTGVGWLRYDDGDCLAPGFNPPGTTDSDCGKLQTETGHHMDNQCGAAEDPGDEDCWSVKSSGGVHEDNDCKIGAAYADMDCGYIAGPTSSSERYTDNDCKVGVDHPSGFDSDCGLSTTSGGSTGHADNHCSSSTTDSDCGMPAPAGGNHTDNDGHP